MSDLINDFEKEFEKARKEYGFKPTLNELDDIFYIRDAISKDGYVSTSILKQVCRRIIDVYSVWLQYLHGLLVPNPGNMINVSESTICSDADREKIQKLINEMMVLSNDYNLFVLNTDRKKGKEIIDNAYSLWKDNVKDELVGFMQKARDMWENKSKTKPEKKKKESNIMFG